MIGSGRASARVAGTVRRVRAALADAGIEVAPADAALDGRPLLVVDPAAWYAAQAQPPSPSLLARATAVSVAAYGTPAMQDDGQVGRLFGAVVHADARAAEHLTRVGCRGHWMALALGPQEPPPQRTLDVLSVGPVTPRRLRMLAAGATQLEGIRYAYRCDDALGADGPAISSAHVLVDVAEDDDASPDLPLLLDAVEAGVAVVTERLGDWPGDVAAALVCAPRETLFVRARELAGDPERAAALAGAAHAALAAALPGDGAGRLAELVTSTWTSDGAPSDLLPRLSHHAQSEPLQTIGKRLARERSNPDAAVREGMRRALADVRRLERRMARMETGGPDATETLLAPEDAPAPRISVLVPAFEAQRTLTAALDSALSVATVAPLEVVVVDDGSPQADGEAAVAWARAHPELAVTVLRHRHNRGLAGARNTALEHARGELVLPLDADNQLLAGGLALLLAALDAEPDAAFAYGLLREFDESGPVGLRGLYPWDPERLRYGNYVDALALIRRDALVELGGYATDMPEQGYEDWDLWCRFAQHGLRGAWVAQVVANYRVRADSMSAALHLSHIGPLADMLARHPAMLA